MKWNLYFFFKLGPPLQMNRYVKQSKESSDYWFTPPRPGSVNTSFLYEEDPLNEVCIYLYICIYIYIYLYVYIYIYIYIYIYTVSTSFLYEEDPLNEVYIYLYICIYIYT
jgi:hypothetical protein